MPRKHNVQCGVYCLTAYDGTRYVGSSKNLSRRLSEHRSELKFGKHHSSKLQDRWNAVPLVTMTLLFACTEDRLLHEEQRFLDSMQPELNTSPSAFFTGAATSTKIKKAERMASTEYRAKQSANSQRPNKHWKPVDCSDGRSFRNMAAAAVEFGVNTSAIKALVATHRVGRIGVAFKLSSEDWRSPLSITEQRVATMKARGTIKRSDEARAKMSAAQTGRVMSAETKAKLSLRLKGRQYMWSKGFNSLAHSYAKEGRVFTAEELAAFLQCDKEVSYSVCKKGVAKGWLCRIHIGSRFGENPSTYQFNPS